MYPEDRTYESKVLDLTSQEDEEDGQYICDRCEIPSGNRMMI
jgi:hypothetical protein